MTQPQPVDTFAGHDLLAAARRWYGAGYAVVPIKTDSTKAPCVQWRQYEHRPPAPEQVGDWWAAMFRGAGIAVVCGAASGNLEMLEVEAVDIGAGMLGELARRATAAGIGDLWTALVQAYAEQSPKGGLHLFYRVADAAVPGNTKLARRPARDDELTFDEKRRMDDAYDSGRNVLQPTRTLIETRGQGGYVIVAPSPGACHDTTNNPWRALAGTPEQVLTITAEQREALHEVCRTFNVEARKEAAPVVDRGRGIVSPTGAALPSYGGDQRPGDAYAATPWANILGPHGWRQLYTSGRETYWCRPGKRIGVSATTTDDGPGDPGGFWCFSTSTAFDAETLYTKFGAYALLEHGGDMSAAARALAPPRQANNVVPLRPFTPDMGGPGPAATSPPLPNGAQPTNGPAVPAYETTPAGKPPMLPADAVGVQSNPDTPTDTAPVPSWRPIDLGQYLDGTYRAPEADLMPRTDGRALFYRGKTHSVFGESESGKSLIVQAECARILRDTDENVLYVDYEDGPAAVVGRMVELGAPIEAIRARFHYVNPQTNPYTHSESDEFRAMLTRQYAIAVIDGVTDSISQQPAGTNGDPNERATQWARRILDPLAKYTGAAVVMIDHVKKGEDRGRFAIGAQAKMSVITGAAYICEPSGRVPIGKGLCGEVTLRIAKDRPSGVRPHCGPRRAEDRTQEAAVITVDSSRVGRTVVTVSAQRTGIVTDGVEKPVRPTTLMERISMHLAARQAASGTQIEREVSGKATGIRTALVLLAQEGYVRAVELPGQRAGAHRYEHVRLYTVAAENATDRADRYVPGHAQNGDGPGTDPVDKPVDNHPDMVPDLQGTDLARSGTDLPSTVHNGQPETGEVRPEVRPDVFAGQSRSVPGPSLGPSPSPSGPSEVRPVPVPLRGIGDTGTDGHSDSDRAGREEDQKSQWSPSAVLDSMPTFVAPAAPPATAPPTRGRLTTVHRGDRVCADPACGEVIAAQLPADWSTHPGCADPATLGQAG